MMDMFCIGVMVGFIASVVLDWVEDKLNELDD